MLPALHFSDTRLPNVPPLKTTSLDPDRSRSLVRRPLTEVEELVDFELEPVALARQRARRRMQPAPKQTRFSLAPRLHNWVMVGTDLRGALRGMLDVAGYLLRRRAPALPPAAAMVEGDLRHPADWCRRSPLDRADGVLRRGLGCR